MSWEVLLYIRTLCVSVGRNATGLLCSCVSSLCSSLFALLLCANDQTPAVPRPRERQWMWLSPDTCARPPVLEHSRRQPRSLALRGLDETSCQDGAWSSLLFCWLTKMLRWWAVKPTGNYLRGHFKPWFGVAFCSPSTGILMGKGARVLDESLQVVHLQDTRASCQRNMGK